MLGYLRAGKDITVPPPEVMTDISTEGQCPATLLRRMLQLLSGTYCNLSANASSQVCQFVSW